MRRRTSSALNVNQPLKLTYVLKANYLNCLEPDAVTFLDRNNDPYMA